MGDPINPTALNVARFRQNPVPVLLCDHDHHAAIGTVPRDWTTSAGAGWCVTARIFDAGVSAAAAQCWKADV